jgi:predicted kinase
MTNDIGTNLPSSATGRPSLLIIVSGPPGAGKTTLARRIAQALALPLIAKDDIKESLFDSLGWQDRAWSRQIGRATYALMYYFIETQLAARRSLIVESNFDANATPKLRALQVKSNFVPLQILCYADNAVLIERFKARWAGGKRHPGHSENQITEEEYRTFRKYPPLDLGGTVIEIDTTDFDQIDFAGLTAQIRAIQQNLNEAL